MTKCILETTQPFASKIKCWCLMYHSDWGKKSGKRESQFFTILFTDAGHETFHHM